MLASLVRSQALLKYGRSTTAAAAAAGGGGAMGCECLRAGRAHSLLGKESRTDGSNLPWIDL